MNPPSSEESRSTNRREFLLGRSVAKEVERIVGNQIDDVAKGLSNDSRDQRQASYLEQYVKNAMACEFEISFNLHQYKQSSVAAMAAFDLIDRLEQQMTVYRDDSEISLLNQNGVHTPIKLERSLFELLKLGQDLAVQTQGAFDLTAGHLSRVWGFERRKGALPEPADLAEALKRVGYGWIELNDSDSSVKLKREGVTINLGGIGKGYALDRVGQEFEKRGIGNFLLHGGQSSLLAHGTSDPVDSDFDSQSRFGDEEDSSAKHAGWVVGVTHPNLPNARLAELVLRDAAIGTSGTAKQGFFHRGKRYGHIIDPRTGWPAGHFLSTTVVAPSAAVADALATAFFVMQEEEIASFCFQHQEVGVVLISEVSKTTSEVKVTTFNIREEDWRIL